MYSFADAKDCYVARILLAQYAGAAITCGSLSAINAVNFYQSSLLRRGLRSQRMCVENSGHGDTGGFERPAHVLVLANVGLRPLATRYDGGDQCAKTICIYVGRIKELECCSTSEGPRDRLQTLQSIHSYLE